MKKCNITSAPSVVRFSVSMAGDLVRQLDAMAEKKKNSNRSQAIAHMVRDQLVEYRRQMENCEIAGTVTLVYDHHKRNLQSMLTDIQHDHGDLIISSFHVHLDHHNCMEVLAVHGRAEAVRLMADKLISAKGVKHGKLTVTTTGKKFHR